MSTVLDFPQDAASPYISSGDVSTFMRDVIEASLKNPVIVDFWATWCGPCKTLTPLLEKHVIAQHGKVTLVKIDIDKNPQLVGQFRIQSAPTIFAFFQGQPVDAFMGALPESQVKTFVERLAKLGKGPAGAPDIKLMYQEATAALAEGNLDQAEMAFADIINTAPGEAAAQIGILRVQVMRGNAANVQQVIADLPEDVKKHKDFAALQSAIDLALAGQAAGPIDELKRAVLESPADHQKRYDLATALFAQGDVEGAAEHLLTIMKAEQKWNDDAARKQLLKICETIGLEDPRAKAIRRQLSAIVFT